MSANQTPLIAIYGGSFDPPHLAHFEILDTLCQKPYIKRIILLPNALNPLKNATFFTPNDRYKMCEIVAKTLNKAYNADKIMLSDYEISQHRAVYTSESLSFLQSQFANKRLAFVLGSDAFASLHLWRDYARLCNELEFIVIERTLQNALDSASELESSAPRVIDTITLLRYNAISSSKVRENLASGDIKPALDMLPQTLHSTIEALLAKSTTRKRI